MVLGIVSYSSVLAHDTAFATANLNNHSLVLKLMETGKYTITVGDNCDFLEETQSGTAEQPILLMEFKFIPWKIQQRRRMMKLGNFVKTDAFVERELHRN